MISTFFIQQSNSFNAKNCWVSQQGLIESCKASGNRQFGALRFIASSQIQSVMRISDHRQMLLR